MVIPLPTEFSEEPFTIIEIDEQCVVPKPLTLYTLQWGMGKKNKVVKLTDKKIKHIIRAKIRGESTKRIAEDMKLSKSSVKRVWMHWTKTKMHPNIKKFGRKKKTLDQESVKLN